MQTPLQSLQDCIRRLRAAMALNQVEFGERVGKSYQTVQSWEVRRTSPDRPSLARLHQLARDHAPELADTFREAYAAQISDDERALLEEVLHADAAA